MQLPTLQLWSSPSGRGGYSHFLSRTSGRGGRATPSLCDTMKWSHLEEEQKKKKEKAWTNFVTQQQQQLRAPGIRTLFFPRRPSSWIKMNEKGFSTLFFFFFLGYCHTGGFRGCISPPWSTRMTESFLSRRVEVPRGGVGSRFVCSGTQSWKFSNLCYFMVCLLWLLLHYYHGIMEGLSLSFQQKGWGKTGLEALRKRCDVNGSNLW